MVITKHSLLAEFWYKIYTGTKYFFPEWRHKAKSIVYSFCSFSRCSSHSALYICRTATFYFQVHIFDCLLFIYSVNIFSHLKNLLEHYRIAQSPRYLPVILVTEANSSVMKACCKTLMLTDDQRQKGTLTT